MAQFILKDSKGKEQTFDHETIYVRDTNGELVQFTQGEGDIPAVVQPLEVTENGTYTAPDGVDGYSPVTVNVAGSGGGLPAGVYWETASNYGSPSQYNQKWFQCNGILYVMCHANTTNSDTFHLYKYSDNAWVRMIDSGVLSGLSKPQTWNFLVLNGKVHIIGGGWKDHYIFDGASFSTLNKLPQSPDSSRTFVQGGKLKFEYAGTVYAWDEDTDSWATEGVMTYQYSKNIFVHNDIAYYLYNNKLYKYENGTDTIVADVSGITLDTPIVMGNVVYGCKNPNSPGINTHAQWYCLDLSTYTSRFVGYGPAFRFYNYNVICMENKIYLIMGLHGSGYYHNVFIMHEVTE